MKQITLFFAVQVLKRKSGVYIFWKHFKEATNVILNGGNTLKERVLNVYVCETHCFKDNLKKYVWKNYFSVCAEITWSLSKFRDTPKLKVFKKSPL